MRIRLSENFRAVFYAPFYATLALGHFQREGVEIELIDSSTPGSGTAMLLDHRIDVTWGGPMRAMKAADEGSTPLICFGDVVRRDPFYLIARKGHGGFELADLMRLRFASVSEVPTPWLCLQHDLRERGLDPGQVRRVGDRAMGDNIAALGRGEVDIVQAFEPVAAMAERQGIGEVVHAASARGPTAYTTFLTTRESLERNRQAFTAMTRAIGAMQGWLATASAEALADAVAPWFGSVPREDRVAAYARYMAAGLWASDPVVSRAGFERLRASLHSGGFIRSLPSYEDCVENLPA